MSDRSSQSQPLVRTYLYVLAAVLGFVGAIGTCLGTELWHLAVGMPLVLLAVWVVRVAKSHGG